MAGNYTLETSVEKLAERLGNLWGEIQNGTPDLTYISGELGFISTRALNLRDAADQMEETLSKIEE